MSEEKKESHSTISDIKIVGEEVQEILERKPPHDKIVSFTKVSAQPEKKLEETKLKK